MVLSTALCKASASALSCRVPLTLVHYRYRRRDSRMIFSRGLSVDKMSEVVRLNESRLVMMKSVCTVSDCVDRGFRAPTTGITHEGSFLSQINLHVTYGAKRSIPI